MLAEAEVVGTSESEVDVRSRRRRFYAGISKVGACGWSRIASPEGKAQDDVRALGLSGFGDRINLPIRD